MSKRNQHKGIPLKLILEIKFYDHLALENNRVAFGQLLNEINFVTC